MNAHTIRSKTIYMADSTQRLQWLQKAASYSTASSFALVTFLTFYESQGIILSLYLKQKQTTTTKIVPASLLEFPLVFCMTLHFSIQSSIISSTHLKNLSKTWNASHLYLVLLTTSLS